MQLQQIEKRPQSATILTHEENSKRQDLPFQNTPGRIRDGETATGDLPMPAPPIIPPGVRSVRRTTPDGIPYYEFHHDGVGLLGSVIVRPHPASGKSQMDAMLAPGGPDDPLDGRRRELLGQMAGALGRAIDERYGPSPDRTPSMPPPDIRDAAVVGHHLGQCPGCGTLKYHLVFAPGAKSAGDLKTQVRRVHAKIVELDLPT